jgi:hypothetical protein
MGVGSFLTCNAQSVTIPGISVNNITYNGTNNMKWKVPGLVEYDRDTVSIKFVEFAGLPITQIMGQY